jgi:hypothetical protein
LRSGLGARKLASGSGDSRSLKEISSSNLFGKVEKPRGCDFGKTGNAGGWPGYPDFILTLGGQGLKCSKWVDESTLL